MPKKSLRLPIKIHDQAIIFVIKTVNCHLYTLKPMLIKNHVTENFYPTNQANKKRPTIKIVLAIHF